MMAGMVCLLAQPSASLGAVQSASGAHPGRVSLESQGDSFGPLVSADGRYVIFGSYADDLTTHTPDAAADVFRYDRQTGEMRLVSDLELPPYGRKAEATLFSASGDGERVAYAVPAEFTFSFGRPIIATIVRDLAADTTVQLAGPDLPPDFIYPGQTRGLWFAADGSRLFLAAFVGTQPADTNLFSYLRYYDLAAGTLTAITQPVPVLEGVRQSFEEPIDLNLVATPDGRHVVYQSAITPFTGFRREEIMVYDTEALALDHVSQHAAEDSDTFGSSFQPVISDDGRWVAFESRSTNLTVPGAVTTNRKVFLHDRQTHTTTLISTNHLGAAPADKDSTAAAISGDGHWTAFFSDADDLVAGDNNQTADVFLRDNQTGALRRISSHAGWHGGLARTASKPLLSPDGEWVLYQAPGSGVFLYQRTADTSTLITIDCEADVASMTPDAAYIAFTAKADSINPGAATEARNVYLWSRATGETELISRRHASYNRPLPAGDSHLYANGVSGDGSRYVFRSTARNLSADQPAAYESLWLRDLASGTNILISIHDTHTRSAPARPFAEAVISADGRYVAYLAQRTNLPPEGLALPGWNDVFVRDLETGEERLVTGSRTGSFAGSGNSSKLGISQDGGRILFTSEATNLSAEPGGALGLFVWDRESDSIQRMDDPSIGPLIHYCADQPALLSPDGSKLAFIASNPDNGNCVLHLRGWNEVASMNLNPEMTVRAFAWHANGTKLGMVGHLADGEGYRILLHDLMTGQTTPKPGFSLNWEHGFDFDRALAHVSYFSAFNFFGQIRVREIESGQDAPSSEQNYTHFYRSSLWQLGTTISPDGRFVVFKAARPQVGILPPENRMHLRVMDRVNGTISILDRSLHDGTVFDVPPGMFAMAPNAARVFFESAQPDLISRDHNLAMDIFAVDLISEDSDNDGLADDWELAYFDTLDRDGSEDFDGDGVSDLDEYRAGTVPRSSTSILSVTELRVVNTTERLLSWRSVTGKRYRVQMKSGVADPEWLDRSAVIVATAETTSFTDTPPDEGDLPDTRFYRVIVVE